MDKRDEITGNQSVRFLSKTGVIEMFAGCLAKTADLNALKKAERMRARGADRAAIWNKTGWFQGFDGKWRFEIPDDAMTVRFGEGSRKHTRN